MIDPIACIIMSLSALIISLIALFIALVKSSCPLPHNFGDEPWNKDGGPRE